MKKYQKQVLLVPSIGIVNTYSNMEFIPKNRGQLRFTNKTPYIKSVYKGLLWQ